MPKPKTPNETKTPMAVTNITHEEDKRKNIPTAEYQSIMSHDELNPVRVAYQRRTRDLDPQLVWRGKDEQDWSDLVVQAPPLYIQEKIHPKVLIDDLHRRSQESKHEQLDLFADFNGLPSEDAKTEFYQHDAHWTNRMILGDSLQVMASLAEREGLRGQVQCIYLDPPYGIKFNSNFQWSTTSRDVKDGNTGHITREPEQVKAFRDTWRDGIHSYLTYLRDRLIVARDLLKESGSIFVQIGDENVHRVRAVMDEVFGDENFVSQIVFRTTTGKASAALDNTHDFLLWFSKDTNKFKLRRNYITRLPSHDGNYRFMFSEDGQFTNLTAAEIEDIDVIVKKQRVAAANPLTSQSASTSTLFEYDYRGALYQPGKGGWKTNLIGMNRLAKASRLYAIGKTLRFVRPFNDFDRQSVNDIWDDTRRSGFGDEKFYVVQTAVRVIQRCILMSTDPGDLVLDPTCGSGTTAYVAEQWGRRWITIDTSRVALALARTRLMGAKYPFYLLADSKEGQRKEAEVTRKAPSEAPAFNKIKQGFVYERVPHVTLKSIANNKEIDEIWAKFQEILEPLREKLNTALGRTPSFSGRAGEEPWEEWEIPREADANWPETTRQIHADWWKQRIARQREIDASIAAKAEFEFLYDKPYEDKKRVRVAGPFTVESLLPHRVLTVGANDELLDGVADGKASYGEERDFTQMILENLRTAGVQQAHKTDKINFTSLVPWPGDLVCAEGRYMEGEEDKAVEKRAAIFIGPRVWHRSPPRSGKGCPRIRRCRF